MRRTLIWRCGSLAVISLLGCDRLFAPASTTDTPSEPPASAPLASVVIPEQERMAAVKGGTISTTDMELAVTELKRLMEAYQQTWQPLSSEDRPNQLDLHDVLNNLVDTELKAQDARARGLDRRTAVQRRRAYVERGFYAQEWDRWQQERAVPTEEAIHQFYEQNKLGFTDPERIHLRQIVTDTVADAEAIRSQAVQGAVFAQLAVERSTGAGKEQGGDIGWVMRAVDKDRLRLLGQESPDNVLFAQLESVAFSLEASQISQPVKGPDGKFYLVLLEERTPQRQKTELDVHDAIKGLLTFQAMQEALNALREQATSQMQTFPERLNSVAQ